jgi:hypothetical protein
LLFTSGEEATEKFVVDKHPIGRTNEQPINRFQICILKPVFLHFFWINNLENVINFSLGDVPVVIFVNLANHFHDFLQSQLIAIEYLKKPFSGNIFKLLLLSVKIASVSGGILGIILIIDANIDVIIY